MKSKHVMLDLETLGTTADAVILSIGAVKFDPESGAIDDAAFYASVSIDSNLDARRRISENTLMFWMRQPPAAQQVFFEPKQTLEEALTALSDWFDHDKYHVWSNGADFDIPMLTHAFAQFDMSTPWEFYNTRCFRTFKNLPHAINVSVPREGVAHNALHDAIYQAKMLQAIHRNVVASSNMLIANTAKVAKKAA